jgi:DNA excision repair protein ERCC-2
MENIIKVSVRELVEFVLRCGDIDTSIVSSVRALQGINVHKKLQLEGGENYEKEVSLKYEFEFSSVKYKIEGRADGIIFGDGYYTIDEIKTVAYDLNSIMKPNLLHVSQAKIYGYIYCIQNNLDKIKIRVTYYNIKTDEVKRFIEDYTEQQLEEFFYEIIKKYSDFILFLKDSEEITKESIKKINFPFSSYRKGQRGMAVSVYNTIKEKKKIFINAPTGIGKTMSTLFPGIKAIGEGLTDKIFYLTSKTTNRGLAEDSINNLRNKGLKIKSVTLTSKEKICFAEDVQCKPDICPYAKGHFDRINEAILDILINEDDLNRETIERYSKEHNVCPFEFSLDLSQYSDIIICDYNYVFDPRVYLRRFFGDGAEQINAVFLIDEAHNLVDRGRDMFSASLFKEDFLKGKKLTKNKKIINSLNSVNKVFLNIRKEMTESFLVSREEKEEIYNPLNKLLLNLEEYFTHNEYNKELLQIYFDALSFIRISEFYDERYVTYIEQQDKNLSIKLFCIDPSYLLKEALKRGGSSVFFSATLSPLKYYKEILGGDEGDYNLSLESPFSRKNRLLLIEDSTSTKYVNRDNTYSDLSEYIYTLYNCRKGNYMVFFPSYLYMENVYKAFKEKYNVNAYCQVKGMLEEERSAFIDRFDNEKDSINFCVLGGVFSEGIDLPGDKLIGVVIVSVGMSKICTENDIIKEYFQNKNNRGFQYAYVYPGMNKVMQAAGRLIRKEEDRGVILLIDSRYKTSEYINLFPREWFPNIQIKGTSDIIQYVNEFYKEEKHE